MGLTLPDTMLKITYQELTVVLFKSDFKRILEEHDCEIINQENVVGPNIDLTFHVNEVT